jgi:hypothetical protein
MVSRPGPAGHLKRLQTVPDARRNARTPPQFRIVAAFRVANKKARGTGNT